MRDPKASQIQSEIRAMLASPETRHMGLIELADWTINTFLMFGASVSTAHFAAYRITRDIENNWDDSDKMPVVDA